MDVSEPKPMEYRKDLLVWAAISFHYHTCVIHWPKGHIASHFTFEPFQHTSCSSCSGTMYSTSSSRLMHESPDPWQRFRVHRTHFKTLIFPRTTVEIQTTYPQCDATLHITMKATNCLHYITLDLSIVSVYLKQIKKWLEFLSITGIVAQMTTASFLSFRNEWYLHMPCEETKMSVGLLKTHKYAVSNARVLG